VATIYVNAQNRIVGGPDNGMLYKGKLKGTGGADVIVGTGGMDDSDAKGGNDLVCAGGAMTNYWVVSETMRLPADSGLTSSRVPLGPIPRLTSIPGKVTP